MKYCLNIFVIFVAVFLNSCHPKKRFKLSDEVLLRESASKIIDGTKGSSTAVAPRTTWGSVENLRPIEVRRYMNGVLAVTNKEERFTEGFYIIPEGLNSPLPNGGSGLFVEELSEAVAFVRVRKR